MERYFNTEGSCNPEEHYMVKLDRRLEQIKKIFCHQQGTPVWEDNHIEKPEKIFVGRIHGGIVGFSGTRNCGICR